MILLQETTTWEYPNHQYLLSDDKRTLFAYIRKGTKELFTFTKPLPFRVNGRSFKFIKRVDSADQGRKVVGSKGDVYWVKNGRCTCAGFTFRGVCKHVNQ